MHAHGQGSIELVPAYLLLGEASIGLKQYSQAEDYLSLAQYSVVSQPDLVPPRVRGQLHRNFGLLYASRGELSKAVGEFAKDVRTLKAIYYSSLSYHPSHIRVSGGYFHLGSTLLKLSTTDSDVPVHVYDRVVAIWKRHLRNRLIASGLVEESGEGEMFNDQVAAGAGIPRPWSARPASAGVATADDGEWDVALQAEAVAMLSAIHEFREGREKTAEIGGERTATGAAEVMYVLAQVYYVGGGEGLRKGKEMAAKALEGGSSDTRPLALLYLFIVAVHPVYETTLGQQHSITLEVRGFLKAVVGASISLVSHKAKRVSLPVVTS
ncbi:Zinc finger MYND domain-containing protein 12 [Gonapodya sp. JEL0774]|nr:Zinc finger MYND domain-containing protein 12 [Gonapodya sp. JEL0774]